MVLVVEEFARIVAYIATGPVVVVCIVVDAVVVVVVARMTVEVLVRTVVEEVPVVSTLFVFVQYQRQLLLLDPCIEVSL